MAVIEPKIKISLIDEISKNLKTIQNNVNGLNNSMGSLARTGSILAASFLSFERVTSGFASVIKSGVEFNKTIETASVGMSGVLISMTKLADRELKWNEAMVVSKSIIKDLNKQALLTAATPQELTQTFSGLLGIGIGRGLNIEQVKSFTVMGVNAVKSMGLEGRQLIQELRDLLQGSISPQKSTLATALGITGADIKAAQNSADGLFKFLEARMNGFKISAKYFPNTFQGSMAVLSGAFQMLIAQGVEAPMKRVTELAKDLFVNLLDEGQNGFSTALTEPIKEVSKYLSKAFDDIVFFGKAAKSAFGQLGEHAAVFTGLMIDNADTLALAFIGWKTAQSMSNSVAAQTLDIYSRINAKINESNAALATNVSLEKAKDRYVQSLNSTRLHAQSKEDLVAVTKLVRNTAQEFQNLGLSQEKAYRTATKLAEIFPKMGSSLEKITALKEQIALEARLTMEQNKRAELAAKLVNYYQKTTSFLMGFGMAASIVGQKIEDDLVSRLGGLATEAAIVAHTFQMMWASMHPAGAAIAAVAAVIGAVGWKGASNAKEAGFGENFSAWYKAQFGTRADYEKVKQAIANEQKRKEKQDKIADLSNQLVKKFNTGNDSETKAADKAVKLLDDANRVSASIAAKLAERTMTNREQAFANLNKEIATFQDKINTLKASGQDITELQAQLDNYSTAAAAKLEEKFNTLKVRWDDVIIHIKNQQTNFTDIITAGYDTLASEFTNFGQNIITEGGNFFDRFNDLLTNFANIVCNTLMKIYLQGLLTKSIMGMFGGGYSTSWLSGSTENASGWLSIGNYVVGHANGGIASGWSLVGEQGPELVNFSNPGRVYTADETRSMIGGGSVNVKVNVINESGAPMNAQQQGQATWDGEGYVINVVMNAIATNRNGMRTLLQGAR